MRVLILALISCGLAAALPQCPKIIVVIDVDLASGNWYEYQRSDNNLISNGTCTTVILHRPEECICRMMYTDVPTSDKSILAAVVPTGNHFSYRFPLINGIDQRYQIIDTDYIDYAILMHCNRNNLGEIKYVVLTRDANPRDDIVNKINDGFKKRHLDQPVLVKINNEDCEKF